MDSTIKDKIKEKVKDNVEGYFDSETDSDVDEEENESESDNDDASVVDETAANIEEEEDVDEDGNAIVGGNKSDNDDSDDDNDKPRAKTSSKHLEDQLIELPVTTDITKLIGSISVDDDDDDDDWDEDYFKKFDKETQKNYLLDFHPEMRIENYEEIMNLSRVIRDENGLYDDLHRTIPYLTKFEKARILGQRAKQLNSNAQPFIKVNEELIDGYSIALVELREKKIPFIIRRPLPNGASEYWKVADLEDIL